MHYGITNLKYPLIRYSFHGRMLALAQVEGMLAVVDDELYGKSV